MDNWEKYNEVSLQEKEEFYSHLNMEDIADADFKHTEKIVKILKIKNLGGYHSLYSQSDTLLLPDVFNNFQNMCLKKI